MIDLQLWKCGEMSFEIFHLALRLRCGKTKKLISQVSGSDDGINYEEIFQRFGFLSESDFYYWIKCRQLSRRPLNQLHFRFDSIVLFLDN